MKPTNPQNVGNAALAATKYLCADNHNLACGEDWLRAILSHNTSPSRAARPRR